MTTLPPGDSVQLSTEPSHGLRLGARLWDPHSTVPPQEPDSQVSGQTSLTQLSVTPQRMVNSDPQKHISPEVTGKLSLNSWTLGTTHHWVPLGDLCWREVSEAPRPSTLHIPIPSCLPFFLPHLTHADHLSVCPSQKAQAGLPREPPRQRDFLLVCGAIVLEGATPTTPCRRPVCR